jgi:hypothetical protein
MNSDAHGFTVRAPRFSVRTPVVFHSAEGKVPGHSMNISESGMLAVFDQRLDVRLTGRLTAVIWEWHVDISVRVVRVEGDMAAFAFQRVGETGHIAIQKLIEQSNDISCCSPKGNPDSKLNGAESLNG